jgi:hypothetical protein
VSRLPAVAGYQDQPAREPGAEGLPHPGQQQDAREGIAGDANRSACRVSAVTERHHVLVALLAPDVQATVFEATAAQVGAEFAGDEGGEPVAAALVGSPGQEGLEVAIEGAIEDGALGGDGADRSAGHRAGPRPRRVQPASRGEDCGEGQRGATSRRSSGWCPRGPAHRTGQGARRASRDIDTTVAPGGALSPAPGRLSE